MEQAEHLARIEDAKLATVAENLIVDSISEQESIIISRLRSLYRKGDFNAAAYIGAVGELVALENLVKGFETTIRQGEVSANMEFGNGKRP